MDISAILSDYTFLVVSCGAMLLGLTSGMLGSFAVLKKQSLLGDGVSHATLVGVVIAFIIFQTTATEILLIGAFLSGLSATLLIVFIVRNSKIKFDTALAIVMSVFFGFGLALLTYTQKDATATEAGLSRFIFGQASSILLSDVIIMAIAFIVVLFVVILFWKEFKAHTFDSEYLETLGFGYHRINITLSLLIVCGIVIGIQMVGVVLMSAMLITPAVGARQWTKSLGGMVTLSSIFALISGFVGTFISSSITNLSTGPVIVICISIFALFGIIFSPSRGIIGKLIKRRKYLKGGFIK